jgi:predicted HNH restriction endonuclease
LETHHEHPVESHPDRIDDHDNLITLCGTCHRWVHSKRNVYGVFLKGIEGC